MVEQRKLYKTKLCVLYRKGYCHRQSCSFAHGEAELRRFAGSFNGRRDFQPSDLRDKLERRRSPPRSYPTVRGSRGRYESTGYSSSRSVERKSDRKRRKKQHLDGQIGFPETLKSPDPNAEGVRNKRHTSSDSRGLLEEQLREVQSDIEMLDDHKCQLEMYLEERAQEADSLNSKIQELEMSLSQENEECKRITAKIKKFIKAHSSCSRLQDELKRSQARLEKLGDQLSSEYARPGANEEDPVINSLSDGETVGGNHVISTQTELQKSAIPSKKRLQINLEAAEESKSASLTKGGEGAIRSERLSRWNAQRAQSNNNKDVLLDGSGKDRYRLLANEDRPKRGKNSSTNGHTAAKMMMMGSESSFGLPSTGMAAHAMDEVVEVTEMEDEKLDETAAVKESMNTDIPAMVLLPRLPPPPPLPIPQNASYPEYVRRDESNAEDLEEETVDVEIV